MNTHFSKAAKALVVLAQLLVSLVLMDRYLLVYSHETLQNYIRHRLNLKTSGRYLDLTVELTFFEAWSARERATMDQNGDGRITENEVQNYLRRLEQELKSQVHLRFEGEDLPLQFLYDPEIDLLESVKTGPAHHHLRLFFFAKLPPNVGSSREITVSEDLWRDAESIATLELGQHSDWTFDLDAVPGRVDRAKTPVQGIFFRCKLSRTSRSEDEPHGQGK